MEKLFATFGKKLLQKTGGEIGLLKTLINKGFPDIWFSSRLLCRRRQCKETFIFIVCENISTPLKAVGLS